MKKKSIFSGLVVTVLLSIFLFGCGNKSVPRDNHISDDIAKVETTETVLETETEICKSTEDFEEEEIAVESVKETEQIEQAEEMNSDNSEREIYAELLRQFMQEDNCYLMMGLEAMSYQPDIYYFALKDLNQDGREELLVGYPGAYNLLVPKSSWEEANLGQITGYNPSTSELVCFSGDLVAENAYYQLQDDELIVEEIYYSEDWETCIKYFKGMSEDKRVEITEQEYYEQPSASWPSEIEADWKPLNPENVRSMANQSTAFRTSNDMNEQALQYYKRYLSELIVQDYYYFACEDVDGDGVKELSVRPEDFDNGLSAILTYDQNGPKILAEMDGMDTGCYEILKNKIVRIYCYAGVNNYYLYSYDSFYSGSIRIGEEQDSFGFATSTMTYYHNDTEISEEEYEKLVKEEYADISVDYHKISAENIEKYVK